MTKKTYHIKYLSEDGIWRLENDGQFPSDVLYFKSLKAAKTHAKSIGEAIEIKYMRTTVEEVV